MRATRVQRARNVRVQRARDVRGAGRSGEISPASIPTLTPNQMAGKDKIEQKKANWQEATFQDQVSLPGHVTHLTRLRVWLRVSPGRTGRPPPPSLPPVRTGHVSPHLPS